MTRAVLYARVSTQKQDELNQIPGLRQLAEYRGYEVVGEYCDVASGANGNRPEWLQLIADAKRHKFDVVLVVKLDRVMRSVINLLSVLEELDRCHVVIECADIGKLDIHSPATMLQLEILGSVAEWERSIIRERTRSALEVKKARGVKFGRPKCRHPDLVLIARLRLAGYTTVQIMQKTGYTKGDVNNNRQKINEIMQEMIHTEKKEDD